MLTAAQAEDVALAWAQRLHPESTVAVEPFGLGYVARRSVPELQDTAGVVLDAPATIIVDAATGEITSCPNLDTATLARLYTARAAAGTRFPAELLGLLRMSGWRPGREVGAVVDAWWARCAPPGSPLPGPVRAVLREFGGIVLAPARLWLAPNPVDVPVEFIDTGFGTATAIGAAGERIVALDERGALFLAVGGEVRRVGDTFDDGLAGLLGLGG